MGTRSLTHIYAAADSTEPFLTIYRQYDGYPSGMGENIKSALGARELVNGFNDHETECNGMGCAAALLVGALKKGKCGNVYIQTDHTGAEEYRYRLYPAGAQFRLVVEVDDKVVYDGALHTYDGQAVEAAVEA